jgi:hypothetical protein
MQEIVFDKNFGDFVRREFVVKETPVSQLELNSGYIGVDFFEQTNLFRFGYRKAFIHNPFSILPPKSLNTPPYVLRDAKFFYSFREASTIGEILAGLDKESKIYLFKTHQELYKWLSE